MRRPESVDVSDTAADMLRQYRGASADQSDRGRVWYLRARSDCARIARATGYDVRRVVDAAAVLSSNVSWERNLELIDALASDPGNNPGTFGHCYRQALDCLLDGAPVLGPKRAPFAAAIYGDTSAAVVDRHILRAGRVYGWVTDRRRRVCAGALRAAAAVAGVSVTTFQAVLWLTVREAD